MLKIGVTGGIGSGKSTVCHLFALLGAPVYDSDTRAKELMSSDTTLIDNIKALLGAESYIDGALNRAYIAKQIFTDKALLEKLNSLVHPTVGEDFKKWVEEQKDVPYVIMECAILFESGFGALVDKKVTVTAPTQIRIKRTCLRDGVEEAKVRDRINNQMSDSDRLALSDYEIKCDDSHLVWPQVLELDKLFRV